MTTRIVRGALGQACGWLVVGMLGCSGESAVVGGNESDKGGGTPPAAETEVDKLRREIVNIRTSSPTGETAGRCLPYELPVDADGTAACKIFTTAPTTSCACDAPNRAPVPDSVRSVVIAEAQSDGYCGSVGPACEDLCVCEDVEATGDALSSCLNGEETGDGWCYVSPAQGIGKLTITCEREPQAIVRFAGAATLGSDEAAFLACSFTSGGVPKKQPLGAVCVPSDELDPTFPGFSRGEVSVDTNATACDSGTCLVQGFQGRVSCPLGSAVGTCTVPGSTAPVVVQVQAQLVERPPSLAATCSCRCAGPGDGPFCSCAEGQECAPLVDPLGLPGDELAGSYCVPAGAVVPADTYPVDTCDQAPEKCSRDRPY